MSRGAGESLPYRVLSTRHSPPFPATPSAIGQGTGRQAPGLAPWPVQAPLCPIALQPHGGPVAAGPGALPEPRAAARASRTPSTGCMAAAPRPRASAGAPDWPLANICQRARVRPRRGRTGGGACGTGAGPMHRGRGLGGWGAGFGAGRGPGRAGPRGTAAGRGGVGPGGAGRKGEGRCASAGRRLAAAHSCRRLLGAAAPRPQVRARAGSRSRRPLGASGPLAARAGGERPPGPAVAR